MTGALRRAQQDGQPPAAGQPRESFEVSARDAVGAGASRPNAVLSTVNVL